jgi:hypothetical protein
MFNSPLWKPFGDRRPRLEVLCEKRQPHESRAALAIAIHGGRSAIALTASCRPEKVGIREASDLITARAQFLRGHNPRQPSCAGEMIDQFRIRAHGGLLAVDQDSDHHFLAAAANHRNDSIVSAFRRVRVFETASGPSGRCCFWFECALAAAIRGVNVPEPAARLTTETFCPVYMRRLK